MGEHLHSVHVAPAGSAARVDTRCPSGRVGSGLQREERVRFRLRTVSRNPACNSCDVDVFAHGHWFRTEQLSSGAHKLLIDGRDASGFRTFVEYELVAE